MGDKNTQKTSDPRHIRDEARLIATTAQTPEEAAASGQQIQASDGSDFSSLTGITTHPPTSINMPTEGAKKKKSVTFPVDELIVTDYYEPIIYFNQNDDAPDQDIVDLYKAMCEKLNVSPSELLIPQMRDADPEEPTLNICELLEAPSMEALEPAFRKAQFTKLIISAEQNEEGMRALVEILEFFQTVRVIQLTIDSGVSEPVWGVFCTHLRKARNVEELDLEGTPFTDPELMFFSKVLRRVSSLTVLRMPRCGLTGLNLGILSEGLRWNGTVTHVYFNDNDMDVTDCKSLAHLLRVNFNIEYMDLSNNNLGDDGVGFLCDAISEQSEEEGIKVLILTNTGLTCEVGTCFNKVLNSSCILETLVLSLNDIGTEGIVRMKEGALRSRTLRHLELRGANIDCEGVAHLAQIIYFNPDLERLDLRDNPIKYPGLAALRDCLVLGAGPVEIELDDREKELQPFVEEIRKKSLGIGEDSFHCPPEERGEDFEEKVKLLLEKTLRRRREGDAYGMQHLAELVDQLKKELQEKKSGSQSEEKDEKEKEESKKDKDKDEGSGDKCKPDMKPDKKDDDDGGPDGPQGKGPVGMTGGSGGTEDKSKSDKSDKDKKDDGSEAKGPVKEKFGKEDGGSDGTQDNFKSDKKSDKDKKDDDDGSDGPDAKGPVKDGAKDKCKPDKKSEDDKKDDDKKDDDGGPDGPRGKGPVQMSGGLSTTQKETSKKGDSDSQQGEKQPTQDGQKRQGTPVVRANIDPRPEAVVQHHPSDQKQAESKIKSPAKPEGQKLQGILKKEVPPPVPDRSKKPIIKPKTGDETMTVQGNEKMRVNSATQVECNGIGTMTEPPKDKTKRSKGKQKESYFCEVILPVKDDMAQGKSKKSDGEKEKTRAKPKEQTVKEAEKKDDIQSKIVGGARPKERTEVPKKEGKKKKRQKSPVKVEREIQVDNDFSDQEDEELAYLAMQMSDPEEEYDYSRRYGNTKDMFTDESPVTEKPKKKLRSPEPSPRSSPLPFAMKERLKKSRGTCAAKDAMNEAISKGMPRSNAKILGESMRRQTEMVVEEEEEGEFLYLTAAGVETAEQVEDSDDEDLLGAVGGAPKLPPRMPRQPPPPPPKPKNQPKPAQKPKPPAPDPTSDDDQPPPIPYPSKYAALGVRIPSCTRYNIHSWESVLRGSPPGFNRRRRNRSAAFLDPYDPNRRFTISDWQRRRTDRNYHSTDEIYRAAISDPVENVYEQVLIPVTPIPILTDDPLAAQHRSRIFLHRSQNGELHQVEPTGTANTIALSYESEEELPSPELHRNIARMRHNFLTTGSPFLRDCRRDVETETDTSSAATRAIKNAFSKLKDNLNIFRRDDRESDFWELEYDKRYDLIEREQIRESLETATEQPAAPASSSSARPKYRQNSSQTDALYFAKPRVGKGSIWSAKSSKIKGKSKKKLRYEFDQYVNGRYQPTWYHPDREYEELAYYDPKKHGYVFPPENEQAHSSQANRYPGPRYQARRAQPHRSQGQSSQAQSSSNDKEKQVEYEPDEKGNKVPLDPDESKWLEYEPDEKGKKKVLLPEQDSKKWLEYEPDEKGKKVEFDDGTTINWYEWEQEHNQPSTSRGTGASGPPARTALGSRLQATITHMSASAARNI